MNTKQNNNKHSFINSLRDSLCFKALFTLFLSLSALCLTGCESTLNSSPYRYVSSASPYQDVVDAQARALADNKLLLVVLGARWCHDSTGLAERFSTPNMRLILEAHYETVFVDVGTLEDRRDITTRFNYPIYYATPTVMVVDPKTNALLNRSSMAKWGSANSIALNEYIAYFSSFPAYTAQQKQALADWSADPQEAAYNAQHAERLQLAYNQLGPLLASDINGTTPEGFYDLWKEVKQFRSALQQSMEKRAVLSVGEDGQGKNEAQTTPALRHYHPFSWETN